MAEILVLAEPQLIALDSTPGNVTEVTVPAGTKIIKATSAAAWFIDYSAAGDGNAGTAAEQFRYEAGTLAERWPGMGLTTQTALPVDTVYDLVGTVADQEIWLWAVAEL